MKLNLYLCSLIASLFLAFVTTIVQAQSANSVTLKLDYAGAEALLNALERDSLSEAEIDALLRVKGLRSMVENVTRFIPHIGVPEFRKEIKTFAQRKKGGEYENFFRFNGVWQDRQQLRALINTIRKNEARVVRETLSQLKRYQPKTGRLPVTIYFTVGGISVGFAFENDPNSIYANLVKANGDFNDVVLNVIHEAYHVMQITAQKRAGINGLWVSDEKMPPVDRLLTGVLIEGTANYVADPTRSKVTGANIENTRQRYERNAAPEKLAKNFALFDTVLKDLREKKIDWKTANQEGFTSRNDDSFYFVGYEMAKAIDRYCGRRCIGSLFEKQPVEFFRQYIALYRKYPEIKGHFSQETENYIVASR